MASKVHLGNGTAAETLETVTKYEIHDTYAVESERTVEAAATPEIEAEPVADHLMVTELAPAAETTISKKEYSPMTSKTKSGPGRAFLGPVRTVVINTPGVYRALTAPGRGKKRHRPMLSPRHVSSGPSGMESFKEPKRVFDHSLTGSGPSLDGMHLYKDLPPSSHRYKTRLQSCRQPVSPPPHFTAAPSVIPLNEPMVKVPPDLPQVQPVNELIEVETKGLMSVFEEILGVVKMIARKIDKPDAPSKPTFEECEKKLNELGWAKDDPLYLVALTVFCDENNHYRELWMKLNPNMCAKWIRMIGRSKSLT